MTKSQQICQVFSNFSIYSTVDEKLYIHCVARNIFSFLIFPPSTYSANRGEERGKGGGWTAWIQDHDEII